MKVLIVEPGKYPREADIEHTLEAEQAVVGGTIEAVYPWRDSACIVCNDNGIAENLPLNRMLGDYDIIHGTFFVCGLTSNDFTDLTPQQIRNGYKGTPPTLQDFYRLLQMQPEPEAQGLALSSELFITGTLNTFARHTNVDTQARIIAYDIRELGEQLMPLGMLVTLDAIYNRVIQNWKKGRRTWIFCDEFYRARRSVT